MSRLIQKNKRLIIILFTVAILLLIPLIAMQFSKEVNWTYLDFAVAALLLIITGLTFELVWRKVKSSRMRIVISAVLIFLLLLVWAELAVGIF